MHQFIDDLSWTTLWFFSSEPIKLEELRIGVVKDFTVKMTVSNKAEDYAYTSKILLKHPENLNFIGPDQVL